MLFYFVFEPETPGCFLIQVSVGKQGQSCHLDVGLRLCLSQPVKLSDFDDLRGRIVVIAQFGEIVPAESELQEQCFV